MSKPRRRESVGKGKLGTSVVFFSGSTKCPETDQDLGGLRIVNRGHDGQFDPSSLRFPLNILLVARWVGLSHLLTACLSTSLRRTAWPGSMRLRISGTLHAAHTHSINAPHRPVAGLACLTVRGDRGSDMLKIPAVA